MDAVIYARFSSDNQREESVTAQIRACTEYAQKQGYSVVKVYTDEARSATTDDRPGFLKMISDIKNKLVKPDVVLVHKLDRFARNRYDSAFYKRELRRCSVRLESVVEHLDDSPESIILESVLEGMAEYYSRNLAREVMKGMKETALQGRHTGGRPPLGYDVDSEGKYVINEEEARAVRLIFEMYNQGHKYNEIIATLNQRGYKTKLGRPFGKNSLHDILRNKKYTGVYVFNRSAPKQSGKRNHHLNKRQDEIIEILGGMPAIIDEGLFWKVQEKMDKNRLGPARNKAKVNYLLSGLIWCGECGHRMVGASSSYITKKSKEYKQKHYYTCNFRDRTKQCNNKKISKELIEDYILTKLESQLFAESNIPLLAEKIYKHYLGQQNEYAEEINYLKKEMAATEKQVANLVSVLAAGASGVKAVVERLKLLESKKTTLETRLQECHIKANKSVITKEAIAAHLKKNLRLLKNKSLDTCKQVIQEFVEKVVVYRDKVEVIFKITVDLNGGGGPYRIKSTDSRLSIDKNAKSQQNLKPPT